MLRRLARQKIVSGSRADEALRDLLDLQIARYPHTVLLPRIWQLRQNLSAYDAAYVALAEELRATLVRRDTGIASASGSKAKVEVY